MKVRADVRVLGHAFSFDIIVDVEEPIIRRNGETRSQAIHTAVLQKALSSLQVKVLEENYQGEVEKHDPMGTE